MEGLMSKKTNEPPKRANHKGNIKFLSPPGHAKFSIKEKQAGAN